MKKLVVLLILVCAWVQAQGVFPMVTSDGGWIKLKFGTYTYGDITTNMTANNAPAPVVVSASSTYTASTNFPAYKAFDNNNTTAWWTDSGDTNNQWLKYDFGSAQVVNEYSMNGGGNADAPVSWQLVGSNASGAGVTLDTQSVPITYWTGGGTSNFPINNTAAYRYYYLKRICGTGQGGALYIILFEVRWLRQQE